MEKNLIWFRNDLRIYDNPALYAASVNNSNKMLAIYIATPKQWKNHCMSFKQSLFIYKNLTVLQDELFQFGIELHYYQCDYFSDSVKYLINFCLKNQINNVFFNYEYPLNEVQRDISAKNELNNNKISSYGFHSSVLLPPTSIKNQKGDFYKRYSPFKQHLIKLLKKNQFKIKTLPKKNILYKVKTLKIFPFDYPFEKFNEFLFPIGEKIALYRLKNFCKNKLSYYNKTRNYPYLNSSSFLSVYLTIGILSPKQCLYFLIKNNPNLFSFQNKCEWFNELIWREFYYYLVASFPDLSKNDSISKWSLHLPWKNNPDHFEAWKNGQTGFPIVDAAMRQLNKLGWMHNRLRMISASFLVKSLLIDWRKGQDYFMSKLIDGNFASNNGGWQWIASTGTDSVPYFRIFNPERQSKKFDSSGMFIRQYIPELKNVPNSDIHTPHTWIKNQSFKINYPSPIINHNLSRKTTLSVFNRVKKTYDKETVHE